jgi:hypothetical protein
LVAKHTKPVSEKIIFYANENENGGSGGARTCDKSNVYKGKTAAPSQIASQTPVSSGQDLTRVVASWSKLPAALKAAILAIVNSSEDIR